MSHRTLMLAFLILLLGTLNSACVAPPRPTIQPKPTMQPKDLVPMELVRVPAGEFLMGSDPAKDSEANDDETPQHRVMLEEFYIGKYEVTNTQYAAFVKATGRVTAAPFGFLKNGILPAGKEEYPVIADTWEYAVAFTQWLSEVTGRDFRLCTEAEWEKACRGSTGLIYPWGDTFDANKANTAYVNCDKPSSECMTPVGKYSPAGDSPYDVADMAGNMEEWTSTLYAEYPYDPADGREDMTRTSARVIRGGSHGDRDVRCAKRDGLYIDGLSPFLGFRVCASPGLPAPSQ